MNSSEVRSSEPTVWLARNQRNQSTWSTLNATPDHVVLNSPAQFNFATALRPSFLLCNNMVASISSPVAVVVFSARSRVTKHSKSGVNPICRNRNNCFIRTRQLKTTRIAAAIDISSAADPTHVEITWQIVVGALAGVTPFVVAGIEFSKRILAQRRCGVCGGSGLVLKENDYFRCPGCGGFLPWQSWKRFFSGQ
ncbi:hypothetical protein F0562_008729 [Nyssa sinensis]|uniref:Viral late gene transcription factor 3 zinc ribbon domain-containing protein n=1 Tax=Nyssa sinensis TaxID=561372 RepID=A0A5J5AAX4_9ASTE|nr:hypothetical protein F0562_008729 [Nyssa sinensis]